MAAEDELGTRGRRAASAADSDRHRQPAGQRAARPGAARRDARPRPGSSASCSPPSPDGPNLVARLRGADQGPTLCLLGHADTVPADPSEWSFDPWAGDVVDGEVRGRGAQDMKDQVAAEVAAAAALGREGWRPRARRAAGGDHRRRGDGGGGRRSVAVPRAPRQGALRLRPQRGRGRSRSSSADGASTPSASARRGSSGSASAPTAWRATPRLPALGDNALLKLAPLARAAPPPTAARADPGGRGVPRRRSAGSELDAETRAASRRRWSDCAPTAPEVAAYLVEPMLRVTLVPTLAGASREGERDSLACRGRSSTAGCRPEWTRPTPGGAREEVLGSQRRGPQAALDRLRARVRGARGREPLADSLAAGRDDRGVAVASRPRRHPGSDRDGRLQRQQLVPAGVRLGRRLRILPPARDVAGRGRAAGPQRRRACGGGGHRPRRPASIATSSWRRSDEPGRQRRRPPGRSSTPPATAPGPSDGCASAGWRFATAS